MLVFGYETKKGTLHKECPSSCFSGYCLFESGSELDDAFRPVDVSDLRDAILHREEREAGIIGTLVGFAEAGHVLIAGNARCFAHGIF